MKKKLIVLLAISFGLQAMVFANSVRPSMLRKIEEKSASAPDASVTLEASNARIKAAFIKDMKERKYGLDEATLNSLADLYILNQGVREGITSIRASEAASARDNVIRDINMIRLRLLSYLKDVDPYNADMIQRSVTDSKLSAQLDFATLVVMMSPHGITPKAKENVKHFFTELENSMKAGTSLEDALKTANEVLALEKGFEIDTKMIQSASRTKGGVVELFKTSEDMVELDIAGPNGTPLHIRMSLKKGQEIENLAHDEALRLIELAKNPNVSDLMAKQALTDLRTNMKESSTFLENNPLLDRKSSFAQKVRESSKETAENVDQLLIQLQDLGAQVGGRGIKEKAARFLREASLIGGIARKVISDPIEWKRSIRAKILEIDKVLSDNINDLDRNNQTLNGIKLKALDQMGHLQTTMAQAKLVADFVAHYTAEIEARGDKELAKTIRAEVGSRVQNELNAAMTLYGVLLASVEGINDLIRTNNLIITNTIHLRTVATPTIAITESVKEAGKDAERVIEQSKTISKFIESQLKQMANQIQENQKKFAEHAGKSIIDPQVIEDVMKQLADAKEEMRKNMAEADVKLNAANNKLVGVINRAQESLSQDHLGLSIDLMKQQQNKN